MPLLPTPKVRSFPPDMRQTVLSGWTITTANGQQRPTTKGFLGMWTATTTARNLCRHVWSRWLGHPPCHWIGSMHFRMC